MATEQALRYIVEAQDRDLKELQKSIRETNKAIGQEAPAAADKGGKSFDGFGAKANLLATGALGILAVGAKKAIDQASDLQEQINKTGAVFGPSGKEIVKWSEGTAKSLGISRVAALETAGTFGNMLVPMGIAPAKAAKLSRSMVGLAADMASFNNASPEETLGAIQSGLAGETEPLRRFGVFLNADRVAAEALALGLGKTGKTTAQQAEQSIKAREALLNEKTARDALTVALQKHGKGSLEAQKAQLQLDKAQIEVKKSAAGSASTLSASAKAQATYALIMKDMNKSGAIGDFAKTSSGLANSQRIQAAVSADLAIKTGQLLLPAQQAMNKVLGIATGILNEHQGVAQILVGIIGGLAAAVLLVTGAMKVYAAGQAVVTAATWAWNTALDANPIGLVVIAVAALVAGVILLLKHFGLLGPMFDGIKAAGAAVAGFFTDTLPGAFHATISWLEDNWQLIATIISGPFAPLVALATDAFGIRSAITGAITGIKDWITANWPIVAAIIAGPFAPLVLLATDTFGVRTAIQNGLVAVKNFVSARIGDIVGFFVALPGQLAGMIGNLASGALDPIQGKFGAFAGAVTGMVGGITTFFVNLPGNIAGTISDLVSSGITPIVAAFVPFRDILSHVKDLGLWIIDKLAGGIAVVAKALGKPIAAILKILEPLLNLLKDIVDALKSALDLFGKLGAVKDKLGGIASAVGSAAGHIPGFGDGAVGTGEAAPGVTANGGPESINAGLWDELALGQALGLTMTSGYRPGAITSTGNISNHSVYPSKAIDMSGGEGLMQAYFGMLIGRPGVSELIHSPYWWHPGSGVTAIPSDAGTVLKDHYNHVHVGIFDQGGWLPPGVTLAINKTGKPERILAPHQEAQGMFDGATFIVRDETDAALVGAAVSRHLLARR